MTSTQFLRAGTTVEFRGDKYVIEKVNPKNYIIINDAGQRFNLRRTATLTVVNDAGVARPSFVTQVEALPRLVLGQAVKFTDPRGAARWPGTYVVIREISPERYSIAKFGGDDNRYVKANRSSLAPVEVDQG